MNDPNQSLLADYLTKNYPVEQIKFNMYRAEDIFDQIPVLIFRFMRNVDPNIYEELKSCLECFKGQLKWTLYHGFRPDNGKKLKNRAICPLRVVDMKEYLLKQSKSIFEKEYFSEEEYRFLCEKGVYDIPFLTEHIEKNFHPKIIY